MSNFASRAPSASHLPQLTSTARPLMCVAALIMMWVTAQPLMSSTSWATPSDPGAAPLNILSELDAMTQMEDPEFVREMSEEETLVDLQNIDYEREALSRGRGLALSLVPGAGWSLIYANRRAQGMLLVLGSLVSYGVGVAYLSGAFDESKTVTCELNAYDLTQQAKLAVPVNTAYCTPASPIHSMNASATVPETDPHLLRNRNVADRNQSVIHNNVMPPSGYSPPLFSEVSGSYQLKERGQSYDGSGRGLTILATTYVVSTLIGAVWSWVEISDQNNDLRKRIESTAQGPGQAPSEPTFEPQRVVIHPTVDYNGERTTVGLGLQF